MMTKQHGYVEIQFLLIKGSLLASFIQIYLNSCTYSFLYFQRGNINIKDLLAGCPLNYKQLTSVMVSLESQFDQM